MMEIEGYLKFVVALAFVLGLIGLFAYIGKRYGLGYAAGAVGARKGRRLAIVETMPLDPKHRVVLLRRDETEHLVLLGATGAVLLEGGIAAESFTPAEASPPARIEADRVEPRL
ncbi:MAG: FliO/MopB family protein [Magnetospiraceae bacterium]